MSIPFAILGIDHVVLRAADPAGLERFYVDVLGCTLEKRQGTLTQLRARSALRPTDLPIRFCLTPGSSGYRPYRRSAASRRTDAWSIAGQLSEPMAFGEAKC